jgi:hypothetical protein
MNTLRRSLQQLFSVCVVAGVFGWVGTPRAQAQATLPLYEPFDYPVGANLVGQSINGSMWTETGANNLGNVVITAGSLSYPGLPTPRGGKVVLLNGSSYEDPGLDVTPTPSTVYASFVLNVVNPGNATGDYCFHFSPGGTSGATFHTKVWVKQGTTTSKFYIGLQHGSETTQWTSTDYDVNTPVLIAVAYNFVSGASNDTSSMWVNPILGQSVPPAPTFTTATSGTDLTNGVGRLCLRQGSGDTNLNLQVDELRVSTSWSDVTLLPVTLSSWAVE